jgi:response regulator RpfG family c-di-GMP phosphodiesterase
MYDPDVVEAFLQIAADEISQLFTEAEKGTYLVY